MLLKAQVLEHHTHRDDGAAAADIRRRFGHDLVRLWQEVKTYHPQAGLSDGTVTKLNECEDVRYPATNIPTLVGFGFRDDGGPPLVMEGKGPNRQVFVSLEEVDAMMTRMWRVFRVPVNLLKWVGDGSPIVQGFYSMFNRLPAYPPQVVISFRTYDVDSFPHIPDVKTAEQ